MRLLTHNMLMSPGTKNGYPLAIEVEKMEEVSAEFNADFMARMVDKVDYSALLSTVSSVRSKPERSRRLRYVLS
jgi:multifunctional methyltransferase subunit TRM112